MLNFSQFDPAFSHVAEVFEEYVESDRERGALSLRINGSTVLDLCAGQARPEVQMPWARNTLACCFSVTKGVLALLAHLFIDRNFLDLDAKVCSLWPEFASSGKKNISVRDILTHRSGLPAVDEHVKPGLIYDQAGMERALSKSSAVVPIGAAPVYHNMTCGYLLGGILERAGGATLPSLITRHLTGPLKVDFCIGLKQSHIVRTATLSQDDPSALFSALKDDPYSLFARSMAFFEGNEDFNSYKWRKSVIGSGNRHATASAIARLYEHFILSDGILSTSRRDALQQHLYSSDGNDPILGMKIRYGEGVELSAPPSLDFGPNPSSIGYWGAGGAQGFADPDSGLAFGYVTGKMDPTLGTSARAAEYVSACYECL